MPLISVVIPTRNRLPYLRDCMQSALDNRSPDIEIIVADNATDDGTREYLALLGDAIRVTRSETVLSMSDNWQRGLDIVRGQWVIFVGDDDCLMPDFAKLAPMAIAMYGPRTDLIYWDTPIYRWPTSINESERNFLAFTVRSGPQMVSSKETLRLMYEDIQNIMAPPGLYHGLSRTSLIQKAKDLWGEFRLGRVPDLGSGLVYLVLTDNFVRLQRPLSVMAFGSKSTGMAHKNAKPDYGPRLEFEQLSKLGELAQKYPLVDIDNPNIHQWRLLLDWADYFRPKGIDLQLNSVKMLQYCVARLNAIPKDEREDAAEKIRQFCVNNGVAPDNAKTLVEHGLSLPYGLRPDHSVKNEDGVSVYKAGINLTLTPIRTATAAAGLIAGYYS